MNKKKIIIISVAAIALICFCILVALILSNRTTNPKPPASAPVSSTVNPDNVIDIEEEELKDFDYVTITNIDTIELRNNLNERKILTLEKKNWVDIRWSVENKYISVLSRTKDNTYDFNIYDFKLKGFKKLTDFSNSVNGILSYNWISSSDILFTQGEDPDLWLHKLNVESGEIRKLVRVNGVISTISSDYNFAVIKENINRNNILWRFLDTKDGSEAYKISEIEIEDGAKDINSVFFTQDPDKIIFQTLDEYIKADFGSSRGVVIKNFAPVYPLCSINKDEFIGFLKAGNNLNIFNIDIKVDDLTIIESSELKKNFSIDIEKSECINDNNALLALNIDNTTNWYSIEKGVLTDMKFLANAVEATGRN